MKLPKFLWIIISFLFSCGPVFTQSRSIDEASYNKKMRDSGEYRLRSNYRVRQVTDVCADAKNCNWKPFNSSVHEYQLPDKRRVSFTDTGRGYTEPSLITIFIGGVTYAKRQGTGWQVETPAEWNGITPKVETLSVEYSDLGSRVDGMLTMLIFAKITRSRYTVNADVYEQSQTITNWIDPNGNLKKQEFLSTRIGKDSTRITMNFEVDPTIRIEVPIQ